MTTQRTIAEREETELTLKVESTAKGTTRFIASTPTLDSYQDELKQEGWDFSRWDNNPVVLWAHSRWTPPIGKGVDYSVTPEALTIEVEWAPTPFAQEIKTLYDGEYLRMVSVGFKPKKYSYKQDGGVLFEKMYLLELSAVPIGANPDALALKSAPSTAQIDKWAREWIERGAATTPPGLASQLTEIAATLAHLKSWSERLDREAQDALLKDLPTASRTLVERLHEKYGVSIADLVREASVATPHTPPQAEAEPADAVLFFAD